MTWLALHRGVTADDASGLVALVDEIELLDAGGGRLAHVAVDGVDRTDEVRAPDVDVAVSAISSVRRAATGPADPPAPPRQRGPDHHGRPGHRHGRAARRGPQDLPRRVRRGAGSPPDPGAGHRSRLRRGRRDLHRAATPGRAGFHARGRATPGGHRCRRHPDRRQHLRADGAGGRRRDPTHRRRRAQPRTGGPRRRRRRGDPSHPRRVAFAPTGRPGPSAARSGRRPSRPGSTS